MQVPEGRPAPQTTIVYDQHSAPCALAARIQPCAQGGQPLQLAQPWRAEHPRCAIVRRNEEDAHGQPIRTTILHTPEGRLTQRCTPQGELLRHCVRRPADFELLRLYLGDIRIAEDRLFHPQAGALLCAYIERLPGQALTRYAGELAALAYDGQNSAAASCLRRLTRHLRERLTLARRAGFTLALLIQPCDQAAVEEFLSQSQWCAKHLDMQLLALPAAPAQLYIPLMGGGAQAAHAIRPPHCDACPLQSAEGAPQGLCLCLLQAPTSDPSV